MAKKGLKYLINIIFLFVAVLAYFAMRQIPQQKTALSQDGGFFYVSKVIDGDTIRLSNGDHVRLIGIDTPESRYNDKLMRDSKRTKRDINAIIRMGAQASDFTKDLVQGKRVRLEFDVERHDKYGRLLAYVYLEDGTFVNARILEQGYGRVMTIPPNVKYADQFLKLQREAKEFGRGLWKDRSKGGLF